MLGKIGNVLLLLIYCFTFMVNNVVMSEWSVNLTALFLGRLRSISQAVNCT